MSIRSWNILILLSMAGLMGLGGVILYQNYTYRQAEIRLAEEQKRAADERLRRERLGAAEDFLNGFLRDVARMAGEYKKSRQVMDNLIAPENMTSPEYVAQNARMGESTRVALQERMDAIMGVFKDADAKFEALLLLLPEGDREALRAKWAEQSAVNSKMFVDYFLSEQEVLAAYGVLLAFYDTKKDVMHYDAATKAFVFDSEEDQKSEVDLRKKIADLSAAGKKILQGAVEKSP